MKICALGFCSTVAIAALVSSISGGAQAVAYKDVAIDAEKWIRASRIETASGVTWPADPANPTSTSAALYSGSPGVVLFLLELHHATGRREYLEEARRGADDLIGRVATEKGTGLYDGVAGLGFVLGETWRATKDDKYLNAAKKAVGVLAARASVSGRGIQWSATTDIIAGGAGRACSCFMPPTCSATTARARWRPAPAIACWNWASRTKTVSSGR